MDLTDLVKRARGSAQIATNSALLMELAAALEQAAQRIDVLEQSLIEELESGAALKAHVQLLLGTVERLADQQAMPDDSWKATANAARAAVATIAPNLKMPKCPHDAFLPRVRNLWQLRSRGVNEFPGANWLQRQRAVRLLL